MSEAYAGKTNEQIIEENAAALGAKSSSRTGDDFQPRNTVLSEESGVNESGVEGFAGAEVNVGRTGQTGGGTNVSQSDKHCHTSLDGSYDHLLLAPIRSHNGFQKLREVHLALAS